MVHLLQTMQNLVISRWCFAEDGKQMYWELYCMYTVIVLLIKTFVWWRSCPCRHVLCKVANDFFLSLDIEFQWSNLQIWEKKLILTSPKLYEYHKELQSLAKYLFWCQRKVIVVWDIITRDPYLQSSGCPRRLQSGTDVWGVLYTSDVLLPGNFLRVGGGAQWAICPIYPTKSKRHKGH